VQDLLQVDLDALLPLFLRLAGLVVEVGASDLAHERVGRPLGPFVGGCGRNEDGLLVLLFVVFRIFGVFTGLSSGILGGLEDRPRNGIFTPLLVGLQQF